MGIHCADHADTLYLQKLALTSPISGGRSVSIVCLWTEAMEFIFFSLAMQKHLAMCMKMSLPELVTMNMAVNRLG
jgi:hypothetical protein